jgi:hypothetical protein
MNMFKMQTSRDFCSKVTVFDLFNTARIVSGLRLRLALYRVDLTHTWSLALYGVDATYTWCLALYRVDATHTWCLALYGVDATHTCTPCEVVNASFKAGFRSCTETPKFWVIRHIAEIRGVNTSFYAFEDAWSHVFYI